MKQIIYELMNYMNDRDSKRLIKSSRTISTAALSTIVMEIIAWLRLEQKRTIWMSEGRKTCFKSLKVNTSCSWYKDFIDIIEKENLFNECFSIREGWFDFSDEVSEDEKKEIRAYVYENYVPFMTKLYKRDI